MKLRSFIAALHAALLCILLAASPAGSGSMALLGAGKAGAAAPASPTLGDNQVTTSGVGATSTNVTVTTTTANELIVVMAVQVNFAVTSVTDNIGLTWTARGAANRFSVQFSNQYWAKAVSPGTYIITVNYGGSATTRTVNAITIKGANASVPFDTNAALPDLVGNSGGAHGPGQVAAITTTASATFAYAFYFFDSTANPLGGSGWTVLQNSTGNDFMSEFQIFSSPQTATGATTGSTAADIDTGIGDAVKP